MVAIGQRPTNEALLTQSYWSCFLSQLLTTLVIVIGYIVSVGLQTPLLQALLPLLTFPR